MKHIFCLYHNGNKLTQNTTKNNNNIYESTDLCQAADFPVCCCPGSRNTSLKYIELLWDLSPLVSPKSNHLFLSPLSAIPKKIVLLNLNSLSYLVNKNTVRQTDRQHQLFSFLKLQ